MKDNPFHRLEQNDQARALVERAAERFRPKPFWEANQGFLKAASAARLALPIVSIGTGVTSFAVLIGHLLPYWPLSFGMGALLLTGWEYLKALAVERTTESTLGGGSYPVALGLFTLLLSVGSIGFSLHGTYEASRLLDTTEADNARAYGAAKDSISAYYDAQIAQARADAKAYFGANNYQGTITYTPDGRIAKQYQKLVDRATELEAAKDQALTRTGQAQGLALAKDQDNWQRNTWLALLLIGLVELAIIGSNIYPVYFDWRVHHQDTLVKDHLSGQRFTLSLDDLHAFFTSVAPTIGRGLSPTLPPSEGAKTIGFEFGQKGGESGNPTQDNAMRNAMRSGKIGACENCGKDYVRRTTWQRYCSEECRVSAWESKTGKTLKR